MFIYATMNIKLLHLKKSHLMWMYSSRSYHRFLGNAMTTNKNSWNSLFAFFTTFWLIYFNLLFHWLTMIERAFFINDNTDW